LPNFPFELYTEDDNFETELFDLVDQERHQIQGAPFTIWKFDLAATRLTDDSIPALGLDLNTLYGEALPENMVYLGPYGPLKGSYQEPTWTQDLQQYGINEAEEINIKFNKAQVIQLLSRPFIRGDIIKSFHLKYYIIEDSYVSEETALWSYIHINVIARKVDYTQLTLPIG
jgi:hypothetical protein